MREVAQPLDGGDHQRFVFLFEAKQSGDCGIVEQSLGDAVWQLDTAATVGLFARFVEKRLRNI